MKNIVFILLSFGLAAEMEVDGDLKVTGTVDVSGNPITNVGAPQLLSDAVNAGTLASVLSDDGVYEYNYYNVIWYNAGATNGTDQYHSFSKYREINSGIGWDNSSSDWTGKINSLVAEDWRINQTIGGVENGAIFVIYEFKRKVSDD